MEKTPSISIIIPVYNTERYVARCIESALRQTFQDFEIICVDDASTDLSHPVLDCYARNDSRITVIQNEKNSGLSFSRNAGMKAAKGKYVYFLDSDDEILPNCLEILHKTAEQNNLDILIFGSYEIDENNKKSIYYVPPKKLCQDVMTGKETFLLFSEFGGWMAPAQFRLLKKSFLERNGLGFYNGIYHEDELFSFATLMKASRVLCIQDILYDYYRYSGSITKKGVTFHHIESLVIVVQEIRRIFRPLDYDAKLGDAIIKHIATLSWCVWQRMSAFGLSELLETSSLFDRETEIFYKFLRLSAGSQMRYAFTERQISFLKRFERVLVYGAGKVAKKIIPELLQQNIENIDIVVSKMEGNASKLYGYDVKCIDSLTYEKDACVVVVGVGVKLSAEVKKAVASLGYENIVELER